MIRKRRRRRRSRPRKSPWYIGTTLIVLATAYWTYQSNAAKSVPPPRAAPSGRQLPVRAAAERSRARRVYRHSVIAGGAYSIAEVERARRDDPIVNAHYAALDAAKLRIETLS